MQNYLKKKDIHLFPITDVIGFKNIELRAFLYIRYKVNSKTSK